jgi:hypothetical protein
MNWLKYKIIYFFGHVFFILLAIPFIFLTGLGIIFEEDPDKMMERHKTEKYRGWVLVCVKLAYCLKWFKGFFRRSK